MHTVSITYDALTQHLQVSAQNEKKVRVVFPKQLADILGLDPTMIGKPYWKRRKICSNSMSICIIILVTCMFIQTLQVSHL